MEVDGIFVSRAEEIADASIVSGAIDGSGNLQLTNGGGAVFNAGQARPDAGDIASAAWPIGSVYISTTTTDPATLLGMGTWARYAQGRVLVSQNAGDAEFDTIGETGGAKTHSLTESQMPGHVHQQQYAPGAGSDTSSLENDYDQPNATTSNPVPTQIITGTTGNNGVPGDGDPHNNLQPYIVVYMWTRTA